MAGTRLAIHLTFVIELLLLVVGSFRYASNREHDPFSSAEPFLADKSGWTILVEDVSPVPSPDDSHFLIEYAAECASAIMSQINSAMGIEPERYVLPNRSRRPSAFIQQLRQQIADFPPVVSPHNEANETQTGKFPPLKFNLSMPQVKSSATGKFFAEALQRGLLKQPTQKTSPVILLQTFKSTFDFCDEFRPPKPTFRGIARELRFPEIIILMGCNDASVSDQHLSSVEVDESSDIVIVRTALTAEHTKELQHHLENDVSRIVSSALFVSLAETNGQRVESVSIQVIDENPASHAAEGADGLTAKAHFEILGQELSSSVAPMLSLLLEDLSFIYGGNIEVNQAPGMSLGGTITSKNAISLDVSSSAYLALPESIIKLESDGDEKSIKSVSSKGLANWTYTSFHQRKKSAGDVDWVLFVPSQDNTPLIVHDKTSGEKGESVIFSSPHPEREMINNAYPNGISIVNPSFTADDNLGKQKSSYRTSISQSMVCLIGFIRAIHGLNPVASAPSARSGSAKQDSVKFRQDAQDLLTFWELEAVARSYYYSSLELAFVEIDTLMALLHQHKRTLALPREVAHKLNNATHLLRESIFLIEKGFPVVYATSLLHGSLRQIQLVKSDHRFMELPYFGPDHYLAVFSPLVLPLVLPMVAGLIREVKRFRKLQLRSTK